MKTTKTRMIRWAGAAVLALALGPVLGMTAAGAAQSVDPNGDKNATTCSEVGFVNDTQINGANDDTVSQDGFVLTADGTHAWFTAPDGYTVEAVVKGGDAYNVYNPAQQNVKMESPLNNGGQIPAISHWFICYHQTPTPPPAAGGDQGGSGGGQGGGEQPGTTPTPAPPAGGDQGGSGGGQGGGEQPGTTPTSAAPAASFADDCVTGVTVNLDNTEGTVPVTFTVESTTGKADKVTVPAGGTHSLSYPVVEDTTAKVTVTAEGMETATHSYAKNCTTVQGVKVTKPTTDVLGEKVTRDPAVTPTTLPFTGTSFPVGKGLALALGLIALGVAMVAAPGRLLAVAQGRHRS